VVGARSNSYAKAFVALLTVVLVVLLDEADVFLEERNVTDQKQNALVSGNYQEHPARCTPASKS